MTTPAPPDVLVVSYRRADLPEQCLRSVAEHLPEAQVWVWDNRSEGSDAVRALASAHPRVDWHFSDENVGFAAAVNRLMERVTGPSALRLNPDARLTGDLVLTRAALEEDGVAAAAPWLHEPGGRAGKNGTPSR